MSRFDPSLLWNTELSDQKLGRSDTSSGDTSSGDTSSAKHDPPEPFDIELPVTWERVGQSTAEYALDDGGSPNHHGVSGAGISPFPSAYFVPLHYEPKYRYPLIIWLHSDGFNENQVNQVMSHVSTRNYLAAGIRGTRSLDALGHRFEWHDSATAIDQACCRAQQVIDEASDRFSVHHDRIVLAGYRRGGTMAMRIAMRYPELFSAVISVGGQMPQGGGAFSCLDQLRRKRLPMLWQWAVEGPHFSAAGLNEDLRSAMMIRSRVEVRQYRDNDEMNTVTLADINHWIMDHVVNGVPVGQDSCWESSPVGFSEN